MKDADKISTPNKPIQRKEDVQKSNDEHIDQDFSGFPHHPSKENIINPKTPGDHITALHKDEENNAHIIPHDGSIDEIDSDGSAGAFSSTETLQDEEDNSRIDDK